MAALLQTVTQYTPLNTQLDLPGIAVQVTSGAGVYIIWAGTTHADSVQNTDDTDGNDGEERVQRNPDIDAIVQQGRLGADWACSMASQNKNIPLSGTTLLRTASEPMALSMSQRLAQRFKCQILLSLDLDPSHTSGGRAPAVGLAVEKAILNVLKRSS